MARAANSVFINQKYAFMCFKVAFLINKPVKFEAVFVGFGKAIKCLDCAQIVTPENANYFTIVMIKMSNIYLNYFSLLNI